MTVETSRGACDGVAARYPASAARIGLLVVLLLGLGPLSSGQSLSEKPGSSGCERLTPSDRPSWTVNGVWAGGDGSKLLLVEPFRRSVHRYDAAGRALGTPPVEVAAPLSRFGLMAIRPLTGGQLVAQSEDGHLVELSHSLRPVSNPVDVRQAANLEMYFPFQWAVSGSFETGVDLIVCADLRAPGESTSRGLFRIALGGAKARPDGVEVIPLLSFDHRSPERLGCRVSPQMFATVERDFYALVQEVEPQIYRIGTAGAEPVPLNLSPRPEAMKVRPALPTLIPRSEYPLLMKEVEASTMAVQLEGWEGALFLLMRSPLAGGGTEWVLAKVATDGRVGPTVRVASEAAHLMMIPGEQQWAFIEKGTPRALGDQDIQQILMVPSEVMTNLKDGEVLCSP